MTVVVRDSFDGKALEWNHLPVSLVGIWCSLLSTLNYYNQKSIYGAAVSTLHQICCFFSFLENNNLMGNIY